MPSQSVEILKCSISIQCMVLIFSFWILPVGFEDTFPTLSTLRVEGASKDPPAVNAREVLNGLSPFHQYKNRFILTFGEHTSVSFSTNVRGSLILYYKVKKSKVHYLSIDLLCFYFLF